MDPVLEKICEKIRKGQIVLWAGSGFSRAAGMPSAADLVNALLLSVSEENRDMLKNLQDQTLEGISEVYVQMHSGSRQELNKIICNSIDIEAANLSQHTKLKEIPQLTTIVTTNYDNLFEKAYGKELYCVVEDVDLPKSNSCRVKLYKIHGDIASPDTMLITKSDYNDYFIREKNRPVWSIVRGLFATHSILFVGYSIEDRNIQTIMRDTIDALKGTHNECYFVAPNIPAYKVETLGVDKILCLDMTAEDLVSEIHLEVTKKLLKDTENGIINPNLSAKVLSAKGITPEFSIAPDFFRLKSINLNDPNKKIEGKFQLKLNNNPDMIKQINDVLCGEAFSPIVLEGNSINDFQSSICGVELPTPALGLGAKLIISPVPYREVVTSLRMKNSMYSLHKVVIKSYVSPRVLQMDFDHPTIRVSTRINVPENRIFSNPINTNLHFEFSDVKSAFEGKLATDFFCAWVNGDEVMMLDSDTGRYNSLFPTLSGRMSEERLKSLNFLHKIYESLVVIEAKFHVSFSLPSDFTEDEINIIFQICKIINGEALHLNNFQSQWSISNPSEMLKWITTSEKPIKIEVPSQKYSLFGIELDLGIGVVECVDAVIENKRVVKKALERGELEVCLELKSKSDNLFIKFPEIAPSQ